MQCTPYLFIKYLGRTSITHIGGSCCTHSLPAYYPFIRVAPAEPVSFSRFSSKNEARLGWPVSTDFFTSTYPVIVRH